MIINININKVFVGERIKRNAIGGFIVLSLTESLEARTPLFCVACHWIFTPTDVQ